MVVSWCHCCATNKIYSILYLSLIAHMFYKLNNIKIIYKLNTILCNVFILWGLRGAKAQAFKCKRDGCGFDSYSGEWNILHFLALVTRDVSRIWRKVGNESILMGTKCLNTRFPGSLCIPCYVQDTVWNWKKKLLR